MANVPIHINQGATGLHIDYGAQQRFGSGSSGRYATGSTLNVTGATLIGFGSVISGSIFLSPYVTGTGSPITTAHNLGLNPGSTGVMFSVFDNDASSNYTFSNVSTSSASVTVTVTEGVVYKFLAVAP